MSYTTNMDFLKKLGQNIKRIREDKHLTQAKLAESADVSISTVARLEIGEGFLTFKTIEKLAVGLGVDIEELFIFPYAESANLEDFIKEVANLSTNLKTESDYKFILDVIKSYIKAQKEHNKTKKY